MYCKVLQTISQYLQTLNQHVQEMSNAGCSNGVGSKVVSKLLVNISLPLNSIQDNKNFEHHRETDKNWYVLFSYVTSLKNISGERKTVRRSQ